MAIVDAHALAIEAAMVSGHIARMSGSKAKTPATEKFFDAKKARDQVLHGVQGKKVADFTIYNKMKSSVSEFDWAAHYVPKDKKKNKK